MFGLGLGLGFTRGGGVPFATKFPNASGAYSTRLLASASSDVVRVLRNSDNAEQNFSSAELSGGALLNFTGNQAGDNGTAAKLYDQRVPTSQGTAMKFKLGDYVSVGHDALLDFAEGDTIEIEATVELDDYTRSDEQRIFTKAYQYTMRFTTAGKLQFAIPVVAAATADTALSFTDGESCTVKIVYDTVANEVTYYKNGVAGDTVSFSASPNTSQEANLLLGRDIATGRDLIGTMYDVSITINGVVVERWNGRGAENADWVGTVNGIDGAVTGTPQRVRIDNTAIVSRDFHQDTIAGQPYAVEDGALVTLNGKPALRFKGAELMRCSAGDFVTPTTQLQAVAVVKNDKATLTSIEAIVGQYDTGASSRSWALSFDELNEISVLIGSTSGGFQSVFVSDATYDPSEEQIIGFSYNAGTIKLYRNGVEVPGSNQFVSPPSTLHDSDSDITIGSLLTNNAILLPWDGEIGEVYVADNLDDDIIEIMDNMNGHWGIY